MILPELWHHYSARAPAGAGAKNSQNSAVTRNTGASAWKGAPVWTEAYKISLATFHGQNTRILAKYKSKTGYFRLILFQDLFYKVLQRQKLLFKQELLLEQELLNPAEASASDSAEASDPAEAWKSRSGRSLGDGLDVCLEVGGFLVGLVWVVSAVSSLLVEFVPITIRITGRNAKPWKSP